ncbi:MAG: hypothetical protein KDA62_22480, partial [Planctomycetales bacterium]|nr:hypothetical protein [Planctomycetales bacterium]
PYAIQIPTLTNGAIAINPSDTFTITPLGKATTTFEFNTSSAAVTLGHVGIIYSPSDTADVLADAMVAAINNANGLGLNASYQGGGIVFIGGSPTQTVDATNSPVSVSGLPPYLLEIPLGGGNAIIDGQSIVIGNGTITKTFEFNSTGGLLNSQHIEVVYDSMDGRDAIAASLIAAVQAEGIGVTLTALGNGMIHIEGPLSHELNLAGSTLQPAGQAPARLTTPGAALSLTVPRIQQFVISDPGVVAVADGDTLTINDRINDPVVFEFDLAASGAPNANNRVINIQGNETQDQLADKLVDAVNAAISAGLLEGVSPVNSGSGVVDLLNIADGLGSNLSIATGSAAIAQSGPVQIGETFTVTDDSNVSLTFQFVSNATLIGHVEIQPSYSVDQIAN